VEIHNRVRALQRTMDDIQRKLSGDRALSSRNEGTPPSIQNTGAVTGVGAKWRVSRGLPRAVVTTSATTDGISMSPGYCCEDPALLVNP
jgi:hypothetical protein